MERINTALNKAIELSIEYLPKIGLAIIMLVVGFWIIKKLKRVIRIWMEKAGLSQDITPFLLYWEARFDIYRKIKKEFAKNGIKTGYSEGIGYGTFE